MNNLINKASNVLNQRIKNTRILSIISKIMIVNESEYRLLKFLDAKERLT